MFKKVFKNAPKISLVREEVIQDGGLCGEGSLCGERRSLWGGNSGVGKEVSVIFQRRNVSFRALHNFIKPSINVEFRMRVC